MIRFEAHGSRAFVLHDVLDEARCAEYIAQAEAAGFEEAPVGGRYNQQRVASVRNNDRVLIDDADEAARLWGLIREHMPPAWLRVPALVVGEREGELEAAGLNERLRIYRYQPGQYFKPHRDGRFERDNGELSLMTVLFFLNDVTQGGQTRIWDRRMEVDIAPSAGAALIFDHGLLHEGRMLEGGVKYVLRSDIMYRMSR